MPIDNNGTIKARPVKSGKREIALCGLAVWVACLAKIFFDTDDPQMVEAYGAVLAPAGIAVWGFAAGVFGLDFWMKNK